MADKYKSVVTPRGVAMYPWLNKPDTKFDADGVYKMSLRVSAEDAGKLQDTITKTFTDEFGAKKLAKANFPFKPALDDDGNETGEVVFSFKSKMQPKLYDAKGGLIKNPGDLKVGGGTIAKVNCAMAPYDKGINTGVVLYLNGVQIIELVEFGGKSSAFGEEDGSFVSDSLASTADEDEDNASF